MPVCQKCGDDFEWIRQPGQRGRKKIYCSDRCSWRARYVPRERTRRDPLASSAMASSAAAARWAKTTPEERSRAASKAASARFTDEQRAAAATRRADLDARRDMPCPYCGDSVGRPGRVKCPKDECHLAHNAAKMRGRTAFTRALSAGAVAERFEPRDVYERDGWICGICDLPVDSTGRFKFPEADSVSLDHIIPLARGGDHTRANTQCAHLYCNIHKGARISA